MHKQFRWITLLLAAMIAFAPPAAAQNKGGDKGKQGEDKGGKGKGQNKDKGQNKEHKAEKRGNDDRDDDGNKSGKAARKFNRAFSANGLRPEVRRFAVSNRNPERVAAGAVARGLARGLRDGEVVIRPSGNRVQLLNRSGVLLVDLDENRARNLGAWRVQPYDDDIKSDAPSFCRSGAGHPVWGRQWCIDKGFGLGDADDLRWGVLRDVDDIQIRRVDEGTLARSVLIDILGDVVFNRLGLHAVTLGYTDPLTGSWIGESSGPRVLRIMSGGTPIAEIVDTDRDNRADNLVVALRAW